MNKPVFFNKENFLDFVKETFKSQEINELANQLEKNIDDYQFTAVITDNDDGNYSYELNYYSKKDKKHLIPYKIQYGDLKGILENFNKNIKQVIE